MLISGPAIFRSSAIFTALITSMTMPALFGESSTVSFRSIVTGAPPNFLPFICK